MKKNQYSEEQKHLTLKWIGIDTYRDAVIYMHRDCALCNSEGFEVHSRVKVQFRNKSILATIHFISNGIIKPCEVSLSSYAWKLLDAKEGETVYLTHPKPLLSLSFVRAKIFGNPFTAYQLRQIVKDISGGMYSDIHVASFLTACASQLLNDEEIIYLTRSMTEVGDLLQWREEMIVDKHCVGGLPGNRTTPIIVSIVSAFGLTMPKTSSRAITSPAGTADTMEVLAPVNLEISKIREIVNEELGCIVWGGAVNLSPADDILIRVERAMDLDSEGQLIASVLSKKLSAGSTHVVIDIPVGPTAKVRTPEEMERIKRLFLLVGEALGLKIIVMVTDGTQPIGHGIGPALEAKDVLAVLQNQPEAPKDLRERALLLASKIIEFSPNVKTGQGLAIARKILESGQAWKKFQAIAEAQGGLRTPPDSSYQHTIYAENKGQIALINNRLIARLAKLAGAPNHKAAGVYLHKKIGEAVDKGDPLYTIHAENKGNLRYALSLLQQITDIIEIEASE